MIKRRLGGFAATIALGFTFCLGTAARADESKDFPPGQFTDNGSYSLEGMKGKVVVLFFFEETCPRCRGLIPERNKLVQSLKDKPVKFIAVDPGHPMADSTAYVTQTKLTMPVFPDPLRIMEARWKEHISLNNIYQWKVIGPDGTVAAFRDEDIQKVLANVSWKYKDKGYNAALNGAIEAFEWNQDAVGVQLLKPLLKAKDKAVAADAAKLMAEIKGPYEQMKADANKAADEKPIEAYDLYARVGKTFDGDPLGKSVVEPVKKLLKNKDLKAELAARKMWAQLGAVMAKATPEQKKQIAAYCLSISTTYPESPTGKKAATFATELGAPASTAGVENASTQVAAR
jgi:thiol-disulfide isomerase/thioredoxin